MAGHLARYGNKGKGVPFHLLSTTVSEFVLQLSDQMKNNIKEEAQEVKYYSTVVYSTSMCPILTR